MIFQFLNNKKRNDRSSLFWMFYAFFPRFGMDFFFIFIYFFVLIQFLETIDRRMRATILFVASKLSSCFAYNFIQPVCWQPCDSSWVKREWRRLFMHCMQFKRRPGVKMFSVHTQCVCVCHPIVWRFYFTPMFHWAHEYGCDCRLLCSRSSFTRTFSQSVAISIFTFCK